MKDKIKHTLGYLGFELYTTTDLFTVPIEPICEFFGVSYSSRARDLHTHDILSRFVVNTEYYVQGEKKNGYAIPIKWVLGWLYTIEYNDVPDNVKPIFYQRRSDIYDQYYEIINSKWQSVETEEV